MSSYRFGCGADVMVSIAGRYTARQVKYRCGATGPHGEVVQCGQCEESQRPPVAPHADEGDMEWFERNAQDREDG